jgi:hypothetical protein
VSGASPIEQQIRANLARLDALPTPADERALWLTFYLWGPPNDLRCVGEALEALGWTNLQGWEGGFLYPKVKAGRRIDSILQHAEQAQRLCADHGSEILNIDADTRPGQDSVFVTLFRLRAQDSSC